MRISGLRVLILNPLGQGWARAQRWHCYGALEARPPLSSAAPTLSPGRAPKPRWPSPPPRGVAPGSPPALCAPLLSPPAPPGPSPAGPRPRPRRPIGSQVPRAPPPTRPFRRARQAEALLPERGIRDVAPGRKNHVGLRDLRRYLPAGVGGSGALPLPGNRRLGLRGSSRRPSLCVSRIHVALHAVGRRGRARGEGSRSRFARGSSRASDASRARAGSAGRLGVRAAGRPLRRREVRRAWPPGFLGPFLRVLPPCSRNCHASVTVCARRTFGWPFGNNFAKPKLHFPVCLGGNLRMLHSFVLSRGFSQHILRLLLFHPSFHLLLLKSKVLKVQTGLALRRASEANGAVE